jgi:putative transcriptional regulator
MSDPARQFAIRERLAAGYAAGALPPAMALLVETQAALSPAAARDVALADAVAGALFEQETPAPLSPDALERVFARIAISEEKSTFVEGARPPHGAFADDLDALPDPVRSAALSALAKTGWKFASPGIRSLTLDVGGNAKAEILRIEPGAAAPEHTHNGEEFTLVLTGAFHDARGVYRVGDISVADESVTHRPTGELGEVCYSLAVTDAPLTFKGALGLVQKLWKH